MGIEIKQDSFSADDYLRFSARLPSQLQLLKQILARNHFSQGRRSIGAELELVLVDKSGGPLFRNREVEASSSDPKLTLELNRFNLELNLNPVEIAGKPFSKLQTQISEALREAESSAATREGRIGTIGILPTIEAGDLHTQALTKQKRYLALNSATKKLKDSKFTIQIEGKEALDIQLDSIAAEGANTSMQLHLKVSPAEFPSFYNAAQIATAVVLAISGNSPYFLQKELWEETRIPLFRQAVDVRRSESEMWRPARVSFGHGWVRESAWELFAESVSLHEALLPVMSDEDTEGLFRQGHLPKLSELSLHHGTVWTWNRAIYDSKGEGNLRIEFRALPSGPTPLDMAANSALLLGLTLSIASDIGNYLKGLTFLHAERNFYQAAQFGLDAELLWPSQSAPSPRAIKVRELLPELIPLAGEGLMAEGVDAEECRHYLKVISGRLQNGVTGSKWQKDRVATLEKSLDRKEALTEMVQEYLVLAKSEIPVHDWPQAPNL